MNRLGHNQQSVSQAAVARSNRSFAASEGLASGLRARSAGVRQQSLAAPVWLTLALAAAFLLLSARPSAAQVISLNKPEGVEVFRALPPLGEMPDRLRPDLQYIGVRWIDTNWMEQSYHVQLYKRGEWVDVATVGASQTTAVVYLQVVLPNESIPATPSEAVVTDNGRDITMRVKAASFWASSGWARSSLSKGWKFPSSRVTLATPSELSAVMTGGFVQVSWRDNDRNEPNGIVYLLETASDCEEWRELARLSPSHTRFNHLPATIGRHRYRVRALPERRSMAERYFIASSWSNEATASNAAVFSPAAPSNLTLSLQSDSVVAISFSDNAINETHYVVDMRVGDEEWSEYGVVPAAGSQVASLGIRTLTDDERAANTTYCYRVRARNASGTSAPSNCVCITTPPPAPPNRPMGVAATAESSSQIRVTWIDSSTTESGFRVERSNDNGATWSAISTKPANSQLHLDSGLPANTAFRYRIVAVNSVGESPASDSSNATTWSAVPAAPTNVRTIALASTSATVAWDNSSPNHGVEVYADVYTGAGQTLPYLGRTTAMATSQLFSPIVPSTTYAVMLRSVYLNGGTVVAASEFSPAFVFTAPAPSGGIRVVNNTVYDISSFRVNGSEVLSAAIPAGTSREFAYAPGTYRWRAETWWGWTEMYTYGDLNGVADPGIPGEWVTVGASGYAVLTITNIPATTFMSGGGTSATWSGTYFTDNGAPGFKQFQFRSDGRYQLFDNGTPQYSAANLPTYSEVTPRVAGLIKIRLNNNSQTFNVNETSASFMLQNGPPSWPIISYTRD